MPTFLAMGNEGPQEQAYLEDYFEEYEPLTNREKRYLNRRQKKFDYTNDDKDKGKVPETGSDKE